MAEPLRVTLLPRDMTGALIRDMADMAQDLITRPTGMRYGHQLKGLIGTLIHWSDVAAHYPDICRTLREAAESLRGRNDLDYFRSGELGRLLLRQAALLRQGGGAA